MRSLIVVALGVLIGVPHVGSASRPTSVRLDHAQLQSIVGGSGASNTEVKLPEDIIKSTMPAGGVSWNKKGARCQFANQCSGVGVGAPSNQGYNISAASIVQINTVTNPPTIEAYGDGRMRARAAATFWFTVGDWNVYYASLATKCQDGAPARVGLACSTSTDCGTNGMAQGHCRLYDQAGNVNNGASAPCATTCSSNSTNPGALCTVNTDCPTTSPYVFGTCEYTGFATNSATCYALSNCGTGTGCNDCRDNGAGLTSGASGHNRMLHTVSGRVLDGAGNLLQQTDRVFQIVTGDSSAPTSGCSTNCVGLADAFTSSCNEQGCTPPIDYCE